MAKADGFFATYEAQAALASALDVPEPNGMPSEFAQVPKFGPAASPQKVVSKMIR